MSSERELRALIVEDDEADCLLAERALRQAGWRLVSRRVDERQAMERALEAATWDMVLTDSAMPRFSGREAIDLVLSKGLDIPVVVLSGTMTEDAAVGAMRAGAEDFVHKGNLARLVPVVERVMENAAGRRSLREANRRLAETAERLALVDQLLPAAILTTRADEPDRVVWASDNVLRLTGFPASRIVSERGLWTSRFHREDADRVLGLLCGGASTVASAEYRWQRADGQWRWFLHQAMAAPASGPDQEILHLWVDVTDRKALEGQYYQAQKMEALGLLCAGIAHDLNNLIATIQGFTEIATETIPPENRSRQSLTHIMGASERAATLVRQLLAFSRRQSLQPVELDLNAAIESILTMLRPVLKAEVALETDLAPGLWRVRADAGQIDQVLLNLAVNARDAMTGPGTLRLTTRNIPAGEHVALPSSAEGDWVLLAVSDTGSGMDAETAARVFEPFFTTKGEGGSGLGLATVLGIVQQSGGHVSVQSTPGHGATFRILLPRA